MALDPFPLGCISFVFLSLSLLAILHQHRHDLRMASGSMFCAVGWAQHVEILSSSFLFLDYHDYLEGMVSSIQKGIMSVSVFFVQCSIVS